MASSSVLNRPTDKTGPKISSLTYSVPSTYADMRTVTWQTHNLHIGGDIGED